MLSLITLFFSFIVSITSKDLCLKGQWLSSVIILYFNLLFYFSMSILLCDIFKNKMLLQNFEAWNNLSNSYIKLGQKARAWKVLQEAVKCDYDNWKIWDNLMVVSTDCAEFEEVCILLFQIMYNMLLSSLSDNLLFSVRVLMHRHY